MPLDHREESNTESFFFDDAADTSAIILNNNNLPLPTTTEGCATSDDTESLCTNSSFEHALFVSEGCASSGGAESLCTYSSFKHAFVRVVEDDTESLSSYSSVKDVLSLEAMGNRYEVSNGSVFKVRIPNNELTSAEMFITAQTSKKREVSALRAILRKFENQNPRLLLKHTCDVLRAAEESARRSSRRQHRRRFSPEMDGCPSPVLARRAALDSRALLLSCWMTVKSMEAWIHTDACKNLPGDIPFIVASFLMLDQEERKFLDGECVRRLGEGLNAPASLQSSWVDELAREMPRMIRVIRESIDSRLVDD
jgi:hypothetical protein